MVQSVTCSSEQISVPDNFPNILKTYAKAVIRTQPYDLLRWSAAYFRCLAMKVPPPVKTRLEKETKCGILTRGYLRVLVEQIGQGYFVARDLLQRKWEGLCLPQEELLKYLALCRMYNWSQLHWLKLFAVMVGSLNKSLEETMVMLCELLTDDVDGAQARIPMWMFRVSYVYLAELDFSKEQTFINGRRKMSTGELEPYAEMDVEPRMLSVSSLQQEIFNEFDSISDRKIVDNTASGASSGTKSDPQTISDSNSATISSQLSDLFVNKFGELKNLIQQGDDFHNLIFLLDEANSEILPELTGTYNISRKHADHSKRREIEVSDARQKQSESYEENTAKYLLEGKLNAMRSIGPPWSWLCQFLSQNCIDQSYNFVEFDESILSDQTAQLSSDESFDFLREKRISNLVAVTSETTIEAQPESQPDQQPEEGDKAIELEESFKHTLNSISLAGSEAKVCASEVSTVISYLEERKAHPPSEALLETDHIEFINLTLKDAEHKSIKFENMEDLLFYIKKRFLQDSYTHKKKEFVQSGFFQSLSQRDESIGSTNEEASSESIPSLKSNSGSQITPVEEPIIEKGLADQDLHSSTSATTFLSHGESKWAQQTAHPRHLEDTFEKTGIEADPQIIATTISDVMILGVVDMPKEAKEFEPPAKDKIPTDTVDSTSQESISDQISETASEEATKPSLTSQNTVEEVPCIKKRSYICMTSAIPESYYAPPDFICVVQACQGIGPKASKDTMKNFLAYMKSRSKAQKGMVMPRNFKEDKCPCMTDVN